MISGLRSSSVLQVAAQQAAAADGILVGGDGAQSNGYSDYDASQIPSRRGKWTVEEEDYANRLIHEFKEGRLPLSEGTTLRTFLSKVLNCDPMRISKKFVGANSIGKQIFRKKRSTGPNSADQQQLDRMNEELAMLEKRFLDRVSMAKSRGRSGRSSSGNGSSGETSSGRQAGNKQHADYDYGDRDDDEAEYGSSGRRVRRKVGGGSSRGVSTLRQLNSSVHMGGDPSHLMDPSHFAAVQANMQSVLKPVTSLDYLAMDNHAANAYQAQMQMSTMRYNGRDVAGSTSDQLGSPSQPTGLPLENMRSPGSRSGLTSWPSVQNLLEASSIVNAEREKIDEETKKAFEKNFAGSNSSSSNGNGSSSSSNNGNVPAPPAYRDLAGMGGVKRSTALAQLEASGSSGNLSALANASRNISSSSGVGVGVGGAFGVVKDEDSARKERSDSIVKFQSQISGPSTSSPLKKGTASIQNFMFLVENGDIPKPEENVLKEPLVKSSSSTSSSAHQSVHDGPPTSISSQGSGVSTENKEDSHTDAV